MPAGERVEDGPSDIATRGRRRWPAFVLAAVAALAGALLAPEPWPAGGAQLEILRGDEVVAVAPVEVGDSEPRTIDVSQPTLDGRIELPDGLPVDAPITITVDADAATDADPLTLRLVLSDGRTELIPIVDRGEDGSTVEATRRPPNGSIAVLALLGAVVVLWVSEVVPLFVTSLAIPVVLVATRVGSPDDALAPFFHPIIALFFGGFLMAEAMRRTGLDHLAAISIIARAGRSPRTLFAAMIGVSAFLSMWMSNTAAAAVMLPIALAVTAPMDSPGYRRALVLGIAYAATVGGVGSAIGTPANPLAIAFLDDFVGRDVSFVEWFAIGLPMVVLFLPIMGAYLWWRMGASPDGARFGEVRRIARAGLVEAGRPNRDQLVVIAVFLGVIALWLSETWHGLETGIVALAGAIVLALLGKVTQEDLGRISWASLLTFGGGLALGLFLLESGTSDWIAVQLGGLAAVPAPIAVAAVAAVTLGLTTVASNTASAAMIIPLVIPLSAIIGVDATLLVMVVAIASSIDFALVIGTPPTLLAYSTRLFTTGQIFRIGIVLDLIGLLLLVTVITWLWGLLGVT
ncbi:MAG TPA: DASS family sodium-coupled anion symporter [Patescibacteria group bacterium]|nr:DASS family sodium-coupled anion symporter [Patescibacteria group bacterium]